MNVALKISAGVLCLAGLCASGPAVLADDAAKSADGDRMFLQKASMGGNGDIALAKIAVLKGSADIKQIAKRILTDHMQMETNMAPLVQRLGAQPPQPLSAADQAEADKLGHMDGSGFDQEYIKYEILGHRTAVHDFSKEVSSTHDKQLKTAVVGGLKMIRTHLLLLENVAKADGIPVVPA